MKWLLVIVTSAVMVTSCADQNGVVGAIFRLREDSPLPSWLVLPDDVKREQVAITIIRYEADTTLGWKVKFEVRDKISGKVLREALGQGYWHPDSLEQRAPAATYPNWDIMEVNGSKDVYEQSERNDLLRIIKKPAAKAVPSASG